MPGHIGVVNENGAGGPDSPLGTGTRQASRSNGFAASNRQNAELSVTVTGQHLDNRRRFLFSAHIGSEAPLGYGVLEHHSLDRQRLAALVIQQGII